MLFSMWNVKGWVRRLKTEAPGMVPSVCTERGTLSSQGIQASSGLTGEAQNWKGHDCTSKLVTSSLQRQWPGGASPQPQGWRDPNWGSSPTTYHLTLPHVDSSSLPGWLAYSDARDCISPFKNVRGSCGTVSEAFKMNQRYFIVKSMLFYSFKEIGNLSTTQAFSTDRLRVLFLLSYK